MNVVYIFGVNTNNIYVAADLENHPFQKEYRTLRELPTSITVII